MFGALWYYYAIEKATDCWREASENHTGRSHSYVFCNKCFGNYKLLNDSCPISTGNTTRYNFGIYKDALQSGIVRETYFPKKLLRCLHWGLQKLRFAVFHLAWIIITVHVHFVVLFACMCFSLSLYQFILFFVALCIL